MEGIALKYKELFTSISPSFVGSQRPFEEADYVIVGVPFDSTSTYRVGARFAPLAIREASLNIETYSFRTNVDVEDLRVHDLGDLHVSLEVEETLRRLELVSKEVLDAGKKLAVIGGEHTISLGVAKALGEGIAVVSFDAHLDLRDEFMGKALTHTTFMRRLYEQARPRCIMIIGVRAVCKEELAYVERSDGISFVTTRRMAKEGIDAVVNEVVRFLKGAKRIYLTIDVDVLDPAYAPAVQNPEPEGLDVRTLLDVIDGIFNERVIAFDLVEVAPHYDMGTTSVQAAKVAFETLCQMEKWRKES